MSLYPYICKNFNFPSGHPVIHVGEACKDRSLITYGRSSKMFNRSSTEAVSSGPPRSIRSTCFACVVNARSPPPVENASIPRMRGGL